MWYSKRQNIVEASTFGSEFQAMKNAVELIESLRYKLRMFGVPIETNIFCDNEAVYKNTTLPESTLKKKHHSIAYHRCREAVVAGTARVAKEGTQTNLSDLNPMQGPSSLFCCFIIIVNLLFVHETYGNLCSHLVCYLLRVCPFFS